VHYLLEAANQAFPRAALTTNDIQSVFAGVRPLVADPEDGTPASSVSREERVYDDPSGLLSAAGGKLTTFRSTGERLVDRVVGRLPAERRAAAGPSRTAELPLRDDSFDRHQLVTELVTEFGLDACRVEALVRAHGAAADTLLREAPAEWRRPIGSSRFLLAEIPWSFRTECPAGLCDLLERRMRMAIFAAGQGLPQLDEIAAVAGQAAGWDSERIREETAAYANTIRRCYQIAPPKRKSRKRSAA
jgi:glycerol-3-phosphate dehydrogenase